MVVRTLIIATFATYALSGCEKLNKRNDKSEVPETQEIETVQAQNSKTDLLTMKADVRPDGVLLHVEGIPNGAQLECDLNNKPLSPCHDGALFSLPPAGEYAISAVASLGGRKVAVGKSNTFIVVPMDGSGGNQDDSSNPLNLIIDDPSFTPAMAWKMDKDFQIRWKFFKKPTCKAEVKCRYPSAHSPFWVDCDKGGSSFTVPKNVMASGLQTLTVQASCGSTRGPELQIQWYGVPADYQPLMLQKLSDTQGRHIFNLVKSDDCGADDLRFMCSRTTGEEFSLCENGNVLDNPKPGMRIKAHCKAQQGPALTF